MADIYTILLVPHEGDSHALLAEGPCGAQPPLMGGYVGDPWSPVSAYWQRYAWDRLALVLADEGKPVGAGLLRAWMAMHSDEEAQPFPWDAWDLASVLSWSQPVRTAELGTIVLLDAEGREVPRG